MHTFLFPAPLRRATVLVAALLCSTAFAQTAQELDTRALAATCANCHGTDGYAVAGSGSARLAGQSSAFIVEQMQAFRSGSRPATVMHQLAKGFSDAQIRALAAYFAAQR
ncbi:MAG: c-type cytochrome [Rhodoferax sp.]|nr:c-type cytochrome [Rhodoferax sp.]MCB2006679.1 c-type cytochrome [Rhodoferax sp.]MCP5264272.1 c-type cytochrome [Rhodoferax sp.]MCW5631043.1 c-type cytochrome [Rhodoferax sp.]MCW5642680.1 c-type cytochrome [Rhodoferax sp.]